MIKTNNEHFYMNAAKSLMLELHISEASGLEFILEQPEARTNNEAICLWLINQSRPGCREGANEWYARSRSKLKEVLVSVKGSHFD